jgi:CRP-like cAMP-binding protein
MSAEATYETIQHSPLGSELSQDDCEVLAAVIHTQNLQDQEILLEEGSIDDSLHVITSGSLAVTRNTGGGHYVTLHILQAGNLAGEMGFVDGKEHSATLRANGNTEIFSLTRQSLESLIEAHPSLVYHVMRTIIRSVHSTLLRMNQQYVEMNNYIMKEHGRY